MPNITITMTKEMAEHLCDLLLTVLDTTEVPMERQCAALTACCQIVHRRNKAKQDEGGAA